MILSPEQDQALLMMQRWIERRDQPVLRVFGFAGTGKTTLARYFAENISGSVRFATLTGKAALVMRRAGCVGASTIHSLIYTPKNKSAERLRELELLFLKLSEEGGSPKELEKTRKEIEEEKQAISRPGFILNMDSELRDAKLLVLDEVSMVDSHVGQDLLSFGVPIIALGDPFQLPPVYGTGYFTDHEPDIMLEEIHRQARDNPIISMATDVRSGRQLNLGTYGDSAVILERDIDRAEVMAADQLIVGRNRTRRDYNLRMRNLLGYETTQPEVRDRVICLQNDHSVGLLNGGQWVVEEVGLIEGDQVDLKISSDQGVLDVTSTMDYFLGQEKSWAWAYDGVQSFDYSYAITCHKAQGSQFGSVFVFDESRVFREDAPRWLYTALTRASERVKVVR